ncbi:MAG: Fic family protein, partial [Gammaproteobacteria bacterium]|nr:Fic family protein [Gammaproteobacteria bacterium]
VRHISQENKSILMVELMSSEALKTSAIEGHNFDRESLQSSIRKNLGLGGKQVRSTPEESGISEMMVNLYQHFEEPLNDRQIFDWHKMICRGRRDLEDIGCYRTHEDPMQIVSNRLDKEEVYFEAPPSRDLSSEMKQFINWFNNTAPDQKNILSPLARAGTAHFYFLCIHPFEDGNGRIARAISEKALSQDAGQTSLISISQTIEANKKDYYSCLQAHNHSCEISDWLNYFGETVIHAQKQTMDLVEFLIQKSKFYDYFDAVMNERQKKIVTRLFAAGRNGFEGGLSAKNYVSITKTSQSTATRDLRDMVGKGILLSSGELKGTRYHLNMAANIYD